MKIKHLLFLALAILTFSCSKDKKEADPQPANNAETNDNFRIEGDWILKRVSVNEFDSTDNILYGNTVSSLSPNEFFRFKPQGIFEELYLQNGKLETTEQGNFTLKGNTLTVSLANTPPTWVNIRAGIYTVDTLTANKLTFLDTLGNIYNTPGIKYSVRKYTLYK